MIIEKNHQLKPGTILDGRYKVESVLGEGGFGITYSGTNLNSGEQVAIKEFFSRDYMDRASDGTGRIVLTDENSHSRFEREHQRFLREARVVKDFTDEPCIVSVYDYFEDNDTVYVVMEYIEGMTMQRFIQAHGKMDPMVFFGNIRPLLLSLQKLHSAGVIHRDISPDNIIRQDDGRLVLLDFGSARNLSSNTRTEAPTYKAGYAPPEQYSSDVSPTTAADIYGLCATMYYCLTGEMPTPSIQRMLFDDLFPVKSVVSSVPASISDMIERGMSLLPEERQNNVTELLSVIDDTYLSPEAKALLRKRKRIKYSIIAAAVFLLAAVGITYYLQFMLHYQTEVPDTSCTHLIWDNEEDAAQMAEVLQKRLDVFVGSGKYTLTKNGEELTLELPIELLNGRHPDDIVRFYLTRPYSSFSLYNTDAAGEASGNIDLDTGQFYSDYSVDFFSNDIDSIRVSKDEIPIGVTSTAVIKHVEIVLSEEASIRASDLLSDRGRLLSVVVDSFMSTHAYSAGDGRTIYLLDRYAVDQDQYDKMISCSLEFRDNQKLSVSDIEGGDICGVIAENFLEDHSLFIGPSDRHTELIADWSRKPFGFGPGKHQCAPDQVSDNSVMLAYEPISGEPLSERDISAFKSRLDALEAPYAFGTDHFNSNIIVIKLPKDAIKESELMLLGTNEYASVTNGFSKFDNNSLVDEIEAAQDGSAVFVLSPESFHIEEITKIIDQNERTGLDRIYLKYGDVPIAYANTQDAKASLSDGKIIFDKLCTEGISSDSPRSRIHTNYVKAVIDNALSQSISLTELEILDSSGKYEKTGSYGSFDGNCYTGLSSLQEALSDKLGTSGFKISINYSEWSIASLRIRSDNISTDDFEEKVTAYIEDVLNNFTLYSNEVQLRAVYFDFSNKNSRDTTDHYLLTTVTLTPDTKGDDSDITEGVQFRLFSSVDSIKVEAYDPEGTAVPDDDETIEATERLVYALDKAGLEYEYPEAD